MKNAYRIEGDRVHIRLRRKTGPDVEAIVDRAQLALLLSFRVRWSAIWSASSGTFYSKVTIRRGGRDQSLYMHRFLSKAPDGVEVRHRDGNGLNNTAVNLLIRQRKGSGKQEQTWSPLKYVRKRRDGRFTAAVRFNGETLSLGFFGTEAEAVAALASSQQLLHEHVRTITARPQPRAVRRRRSVRRGSNRT